MYGLLSGAEEAAEPEASPPQRFLRRYESGEPRILENGPLLMSFLFHFHFKVIGSSSLLLEREEIEFYRLSGPEVAQVFFSK
ncbi:hypothetical protein EOD39_15938 [Acipenser ruthenus]|uniref:Uncharacterized protein n=1 Tax=Acipenser ruthenus TaxID=7906 RepID=A0A444V740_ACIRT|nr:hypothetical protein EOD39_15938 [Acipenser ruthenus]